MGNLFNFPFFESRSNLKNLVLKSIKEQLILFLFQSLLDMTFLINSSEQLVIRLDFGMPDESTTNRTGDRLIRTDFKHAFDAVITEKVIIRTCQHGPSSHYVIGLEAYITKRAI